MKTNTISKNSLNENRFCKMCGKNLKPFYLKDLEKLLEKDFIYPIFCNDCINEVSLTKQEDHLIEEQAKLNSVLEIPFLDEEFKKANFKDFDKNNIICPKYESITNYSVNSNGSGLVIFGERSGSGKTHLAAAIANKHYGNHLTIFINTEKMVNRLISFKTRDLFLKKLPLVDLLIIDDIGIEREKDNFEIYSIVNERWANKKCTIYTTNLNPEQLHEKEGSRIFSRIAQRSDFISLNTIDGIDYRIKKRELT